MTFPVIMVSVIILLALNDHYAYVMLCWYSVVPLLPPPLTFAYTETK